MKLFVYGECRKNAKAAAQEEDILSAYLTEFSKDLKILYEKIDPGIKKDNNKLQ